MIVPQFAPFIGREEFLAMEECFNIGWITEGPKAEEFVQRLQEMLGVKHAVLAPNGTLALYLALRAAQVGPGQEVIVPDFTFIAAANAVEMTGATPVFVDVTPGTLQIDVSKCERLLTPRTVAVMPVPIFGAAPRYNELIPFAQQHGLIVIEDACEALGVTYMDKCVGSFGDAGCFSFFADKTLTTGEGGLVVTNSDELYRRLVFLRNQGRLHRGSFVHPEIGYNFRMTDFQCAIGLAQLKKLPEIIERKRGISADYAARLGSVPEVRLTEVEPGSSYIPFRVTILAERKNELMASLERAGVQPRSFFYPLHKQPCYQHLKSYAHPTLALTDEQFPVATDAYERGICLPTFAGMAPEQVAYVCDAIEAFYEARQV